MGTSNFDARFDRTRKAANLVECTKYGIPPTRSCCVIIFRMQSSENAPCIVVDTDVWVAGLRGTGAANRVLLGCLLGRYSPLMGTALLAEYESLMNRSALWQVGKLTTAERNEFLDIFLSVCTWTRIYYTWRPNLIDESDNHLIELAVAGNAKYIVTRNVRDLIRGELRFPQLTVATPQLFLEETSWAH
jgi:predicted nucleic acid-binding protein